MIRIFGALERLAVTIRAVCWRCREPSRDMATHARNARVGAGQFETAQVMIEFRSLPLHGRVARFALSGEVALAVVGVRRPVEVRLMTAVALLHNSCEASIHVAACTLCI